MPDLGRGVSDPISHTQGRGSLSGLGGEECVSGQPLPPHGFSHRRLMSESADN